jgi:hypothetical protein
MPSPKSGSKVLANGLHAGWGRPGAEHEQEHMPSLWLIGGEVARFVVSPKNGSKVLADGLHTGRGRHGAEQEHD